jgi:hypothetical protein
MRHFAISALSVSTLMGLLFFSAHAGQGQDEPAPFEIRLPSEVRSEQVQVRYYLTGPFGAKGGFLKAEPERNSYLIETSVNHQAADSLRVILYAPGCQIVTLSIDSISEAEKGADVNCEDLPPMTFSGRVDLPEALRARPYEVEIGYEPYWALSFFHSADGPVTSFVLARVAPDENGAFHVELPNFNKDRETVSHRREAGLQFIARELDTGNIVALLAPVNVHDNDSRYLAIKPKYPAEVIFKPVAQSPQDRNAGPAGKDAH